VQKQPPTTPAADDGKLQQEEDSPEMAGATPRERHMNHKLNAIMSGQKKGHLKLDDVYDQVCKPSTA
jgi:hypothetical protein